MHPRDARWLTALLALVGACDRPAPPVGQAILDAAIGPSTPVVSAPAAPRDAWDPLVFIIEEAGLDWSRIMTSQYRDEAIRILGAPMNDCGGARPCDFEILVRSDDPRASRALVALLGRPHYISREFLIQAMARHPRPEYLRAVEALLDDPALATAPATEYMYYGLMHSAITRSTKNDRTARATAQIHVLSQLPPAQPVA